MEIKVLNAFFLLFIFNLFSLIALLPMISIICSKYREARAKRRRSKIRLVKGENVGKKAVRRRY